MADKTIQNSTIPSNNVKDNLSDEAIVEKTKWTTNAKWIVGILILIVLLLLSVILKDCVVQGDNLIHGIENFSTILSIFLSITSMAFAGYTSIETGRQYHSMSKAVTQIETTNKIMSSNYRDLLRHYHDTVKHFSKYMGEAYGNQQQNHAPKVQMSDKDFKSNNLQGTTIITGQDNKMTKTQDSGNEQSPDGSNTNA